MHNVLIIQFEFLPTEKAETYLQSCALCVLIDYSTYLSLLVRLEGKHDSWGNREFQFLDLWFPPKYSPVSTPSSLNMPLYPPLLLIVSDTGLFWLQGHRTTQNSHCALQCCCCFNFLYLDSMLDFSCFLMLSKGDGIIQCTVSKPIHVSED